MKKIIAVTILLFSSGCVYQHQNNQNYQKPQAWTEMSQAEIKESVRVHDIKIAREAARELAKFKKENKEIKKLHAELKNIPVSDIKANLIRYERLLELEPRNWTYKIKCWYYKDNHRFTEMEWKSILNKQIAIDMPDYVAEISWGKPSKINRSVGSYGIHEQWVYSNAYVYFRNGVLTSWQSSR